MDIRYFLDPESWEPHIYEHGVTENEVEDVLNGAGDDLRGTNDTRIKLGKAYNGRYLKIVYTRDSDDSIFVITAYELKGKAKKAFRRRQRRKPR